MKRRRAIFSILVLGGGVAATYTGFRIFNIYKKPDIAFLSKNSGLVEALATTVIPQIEVLKIPVGETVSHLIINCLDRPEQNNFINGLHELQEFSNNHFSKNFVSLSKSDRIEVLNHFRIAGSNYSGILGKVKNKFAGRSFFRLLKDYTTIAFCTSEKGATEALAYIHIPARFNGCIPSEGMRAWATK